MRLTHLQYHQIRGSSGACDIAPVTVIAGPNGSGKTTRLVAIASALTGDSPALAEGQAAGTKLTFGADATVTQKWGPKRIAHVVEASGGGADGAKSTGAWVAARLGAVRLGLADLVTLPPKQRQARLLSLVRALPEGLPVDAAALATDLGEHVLAALAAPANEKLRPAPVPAGWGALDAEKRAEWLARAVDILGSTTTFVSREATTVERQIADLAQLDAAAPVDGDYGEARAAVEAAQQALATAEGHLSAVRQLGGTYGEVRARIDAAASRRDALRRELQTLATAETIAAPYGERIAAARANMTDASAVDAEAQQASRRLEEADRAHRRALEAVEACRRQSEEARRVMDGLRPGAPCPTCTHPLAATQRFGDAELAVGDAERRHEDALLAEREARRGVETARSAATEAKREALAVAALREAVEAEVGAITRERDAAVRANGDTRARLLADGNAAKRAQEADEALLSRVPSSTDPELLEATVEGCRADLERRSAAYRLHEATANRREQRATAQARQTALKEQLAALKAGAKQLAEWRSALVDGAAQALVEAANGFASRIWPGIRYGLTNDTDGCQIVLYRGPFAVPIAEAARSEVLVFGVAAQAAMLGEEGAGWRAVLLDEAQELYPPQFGAFVAALLEACRAGLLENAILAGALTREHLDQVPDAADVTVIWLDTPETAAAETGRTAYAEAA